MMSDRENNNMDAKRIDAIYPISPFQEALLSQTVVGRNVDQARGISSCILRGQLDIVSFEEAWNQIVRRQPVLRTSFVWKRVERPVQVVHKELNLPVKQEDWRQIPFSQREKLLKNRLDSELRLQLSPSETEAARLFLFQTAGDTYSFIFSYSRLLLDERSAGLLLKELFVLYDQLYSGREPRPNPVLPYRDYIVWLGQQDQSKAEVFWKTAFEGFSSSTALSAALHSVNLTDVEEEYGERQARLPLSVVERSLRKTTGHNPDFATLLGAAWALLLNRYCGEREVSFGITISARPEWNVDGEMMLGPLTNTLPALVKAPEEKIARVWLEELHTQLAGLRQYAYSSPAQIRQWVGRPEDSPLFESRLLLDGHTVDASATQTYGNLSVSGMRNYSIEGPSLSIGLLPGSDPSLRITYRRNCFDGETVDRMSRHLESILDAISANPETKVSELSILSRAEQQEILVAWNRTESEYENRRCIHELFESRAEVGPDAIAVIYENHKLSYQELNNRSNQLARYLKELGVGPETRVGICLNRSVRIIEAMLGVLKSGASYVPLDPTYPPERLAYMMEDAKVITLISEQELIERLGSCKGQIIKIDADWETISNYSVENPVSGVAVENLAYVIYTSGSTGQPKGVMTDHLSFSNRILSLIATYSLNPEHRMLQFLSISFDVAAGEIFPALLSGGSLVLHRNPTETPPADLMHECERLGVTTLHLPPAYLDQVTNGSSTSNGLDLNWWKLVMTGGESFSVERLGEWMRRAPRSRFFNEYGPTEATITSTVYEASAGTSTIDGTRVSIGRPIANTKGYILDKQGRPTPVGVAGMLYISGVGLARGYINRADSTAEQFIPNPFNGMAGGRMYRTGDLCRYLPDGKLDFLGRVDNQVKVRGYRVELGEIENVLNKRPGVRQAVVTASSEGSSNNRLTAFIVPDQENSELSVKELRSYLGNHLPEYMIPAKFTLIESMPLTANGKVDRKKLPTLPTLEDMGKQAEEGDPGPRTQTEEILVGIFKAVLKLDRVGIHDNFFELGGDSIISIQIISSANEAGLGLTPKQLYQHQTIAELAAVAGNGGPVELEQESVVGDAPLTPVQQWFFQADAQEPEHYNQAVMLEANEELDVEALRKVVSQLVKQHDVLRHRFRQTDSGWKQVCDEFDGTIALEVMDLSEIDESSVSVTIEEAAEKYQKGIDLSHGPLMRFVVFDGKGRRQRVLIIVHHLVIDGVSWRILLSDLERGYEQARHGEMIKLGAKTTSYKRWAERLREEAQSERAREEAGYWLADAVKRVKSLPIDREGANTVVSSNNLAVSLNRDETARLLQDVARVYKTQINEVLLGAVASAISEWSGQQTVLVEMEGHGREEIIKDVDLTRTVGWFTTFYPVRVEVRSRNIVELLRNIKEQGREAGRRGIYYGMLRYLSDDSRLRERLRALPQAEISFNYFGQLDLVLKEGSLFRAANESVGEMRSRKEKRRHLIEINGSVIGGRLQMIWTYSENIHKRETIEAVAERAMEALREVIAGSQGVDDRPYTPSDFPLATLNQRKLDQLLSAGKDIEDIYALSPLQKAMLFHTISGLNPQTLFLQLTCDLRGKIELSAFKKAWQRLIERHPIFRAAFEWEDLDDPVQVVHRQVKLPIDYMDWRTTRSEEQESRFQVLVQADHLRGFDLSNPPLMRMSLIRLTEDLYRLVWSHHHLLGDGWSSHLILQEVLTGYDAYLRGEEPVAEEKRSYREYIAWLKRQDQQKAESYWRERLTGFSRPTKLGVDKGRGALASRTEGYQDEQVAINREATAKLQDFARRNRLTINTILQGAWGLLLSRHGGEEDIVFGITVSGRPVDLPGSGSIIGPFINTLPVRLQIPSQVSLLSWLTTIQSEQIELGQYEYSSFVEQYSDVPPGMPLYESILIYENAPVAQSSRKREQRLEISDIHSPVRTKYPLTLVSGPGPELPLSIAYDLRRFDGHDIGRLLSHLRNIIDGITTRPEQPVRSLSLLSRIEQDQMLALWQGAKRVDPENSYIHHRFEAQADKTPDAIAVDIGQDQIAYRELNRRANQLAAYLQTLGVGPEVEVGIYIEPSIALLIGLLGVLKAGGTCLTLRPLDDKKLFLELGVPVVLTHGSLVLEDLEAKAKIIALDSDWETISGQGGGSPNNKVEAENLAFITFTSGATGEPKRVMITHRGLQNHLLGIEEAIGITQEDRVLHRGRLCAEVSTLDVFGPLITGARLVIAPQESCQDLDRLLDLIAGQQVTAANFTPSTFSLLLNEEGVRNCNALRRIILSGETLCSHIQKRTFERLNISLYNVYQVSEGSGAITNQACRRQFEGGIVPVGRTIANTRVYLLDTNLQPIPPGVIGEVWIGGEGLARGYAGHPDLTAGRFTPNPFGTDPGERIFRTSDLARCLPDGSIELLNHREHQIQTKFSIIESALIESALMEYPGVDQAALAPVGNASAGACLTAYLACNRGSAPSPEALRQFLRERFSAQMIPSAFVIEQTLKLTIDGRIDRRALAIVKPSAGETAAALANNAAPYQEILRAIWADLFGIDEVGREENFFEMGGHSLLATQLISRVREVFKIDLPLRSVFEEPTIEGLAQRIEQTIKVGETAAIPPLVRVEREIQTGVRLPLSFAQQRMWFLAQLAPDNPFYNCPAPVKLEGKLDLRALEKAINEIVRRHEALRTMIEVNEGEPMQVIQPWEPRSLQVEDLTTLTQEERDEAVERISREDAETAFDLSTGPLIRVKVLKLAEEEHVVLFMMHHIVCDGWSRGILVREVGTLYSAYSVGEPSPLEDLEIQYADFAVWQRNWLQGEALERQMSYWREQLTGLAPLKLPTDFPRPTLANYRGSNSTFDLSEELTQGLQELSRREGVTLFMTLLASFQTLLMRYAGQEEIAVGTPIANRTRTETEALIGFFVNTLVLKTQAERKLSFQELLGRVREVCLGAYAHQDLPFELLVERLQPERDLSRQPLFQVMLVLQNAPTEKLELPGLRWSYFGIPAETSKFDVLLSAALTGNRLGCNIEYSSDLFEASTIERMVGHLQVLLKEVVRNPRETIAEIEYLTERERGQILEEWNGARRECPAEHCIHELVEEQVEHRPDAVAVAFEGACLSYRELNRRANQLARHLRGIRIGPDVRVGILLDRSIEMMVGLLGILKAGGAYVPMDPAYPRERISLMIDDAQVGALITQQRLLESVAQTKLSVLCLDRDWEIISSQEGGNLQSGVSGENLAYVIYTSGSTGSPKGALITHKNVMRLFSATDRQFHFDAQDVWTLFHSYSFDFSVWEMWGALTRGGRLIVVPYWVSRSPEAFYDLLSINGVTVLNQTPSAFSQLMGVEQNGERKSLDLRLVIFGGEALEAQSLWSWIDQHSDERPELINMYGITETTVHVTYWRVRKEEVRQAGGSLIGHGLDDLQTYILDERRKLAPVGIVGEIYVGGAGLARGYLNRADLTAERFVVNPFSKHAGERLYKTGDVAKYRTDGGIEYIGRSDNQVKIRGFRIELGEIEQALLQHPDVSQSVVVLREDHLADKRIIAYITTHRKEDEINHSPQAAESSAQQVSHWQMVFDQTYDSPAPTSSPEFNIIGWDSAYTGKPIEPEAMREWLDSAVDGILSCRPNSVLEIGCGTGLLLFRIAPHCSRYLATDFSRQALTYIDHQSRSRQDLSHVTLFQRTADNFEGIEPESFDTVILNSVAQYFPSIEYLVDVLEKAVRSVKSGGSVIVGDVRSLPLLKAFHVSLQLCQAPPSSSPMELMAQAQRRLRKEKELVIDPVFFIALKRHLPRVKHVEIQLKRGRDHNELTKYRYEAILHVSDEDFPSVECSWLDWYSNSLNLPAVKQILSSDGPEILAIKQAPNARLIAEKALLEMLSAGAAPDSLNELHEMLRQVRETGIEPNDVIGLGRDLNYRVSINWSGEGADGYFDVVFFRQDTLSDGGMLPAISPSPTEMVVSSGSWKKYANDPLKPEPSASLIAELRRHVKQKLPEYMAPSAFVLMDEFPLTTNGKVDRRALPAPEVDKTEAREGDAAPRTPIQEMLLGIFEDVLKVDRVGRGDNFFEIGGHSLLATQVISRVRDMFGVEIGVRSIFEKPTAEGLAREVEQLMQAGEQDYAPPLVKVRREGDSVMLPLSFAQQRLWFLDQLAPNNPFYNCPCSVRLEGRLDLEALEGAVNEIIRRHEVLRTRIVVEEGSPVQVIDEWKPGKLEVKDLAGWTPEDKEAEVGRITREEAGTGFDLGLGPMIRVKVLKLGEEEHVLFFTMHHIVSDGWSMGILIREVGALYRAYSSGEPSPLEDLPIQYADFAVWQRQWLRGEALEAELEYWRRRLQGIETLELLTDHPRPAVSSYRGAAHSFVLERELAEKLRASSQREGVTLFMTLLGGFDILLSRYSGQEDIVIGTDIANRNRAEIEGLIGFFVNQLVIRVGLRSSESFSELLKKVREVCLGAYAHQDVPFEKLVEELQPQRDLSRSPLFQVKLVLQNAPRAAMELGGARLSSNRSGDAEMGGEAQPAKFDLTVAIMDEDPDLVGVIGYSRDLFEEGTIAQLMRHYLNVLREIVEDGRKPISELSLLSDQERKQIVVDWNRTGRPYPEDRCIHEQFRELVEWIPDQIALVHERQMVSYGELNVRANQLAHYLQRLGVGPDMVVGLCLDRSVQMVVGLMGVLKAGGAYLPLDPDSPLERLNYLLEDAEVGVVVTERKFEERLPASSGQTVLIDLEWEKISRESGRDPQSGVIAENLAYVIYTSGSTGAPKGVAVEHHGVVNLGRWQAHTFGLSPQSRISQFFSYNFDGAVGETFMALLNEAALIISTPEDLEPRRLLQFLNREQINVAVFVPSLLKQLDPELVEYPEGLTIVSVGERCPVDMAAEWSKRCRFINAYGPTEYTVYSHLWEVEPEDVKKLGRVPIGYPIDNTRSYVLDERLRPAPPGVAGEIYLAGAGIARGYHNQPELTAEKFIPNHLSSFVDSNEEIRIDKDRNHRNPYYQRLYKTGDLGCYLSDGSIHYLSRIDYQVKVRGFRIELGEIEAALNEHRSVRRSVVIASEDEGAGKRLIGYVVGEEVTAAELKRHVRERVPEYMAPAAIVILEEMPVTAGGKIDRKKLPSLEDAGRGVGQDYSSARTPVEEILLGIFEEVLKLDHVGRSDNFFDIGGHSLLATQVVSRVRNVFGVEIGVGNIFEAPKAEDLARKIEGAIEAGQVGTAPPLVRVEREDQSVRLPLSFAQQRLWFLDQLVPNNPFYNCPGAVKLEGKLDIEALEGVINEIVRRHEVFRTRIEVQDGAPAQIIDKWEPRRLEVENLASLSKEVREIEVTRIRNEEAETGFDLGRGPLLRVRVLRIGEEEHVLLFTTHHIVSDGWSMGVLVREVGLLYEAMSVGKESPLPEPELQYADYAKWEREYLAGGVLEGEVEYWKKRLKGAAVLELPTDRTRPASPSYRGGSERVEISQDLSAGLKMLSQREGATLFMTLMAAFKVVLMRYSGQEDISVGTVIANRSRREVEELIGFFVNTLVMRTDLAGNPSFRDLIKREREVALGAYAHQKAPFEKLVEEIDTGRDLSRSPLFQVMMTLQNTKREEMEIRGLKVTQVGGETGVAKFDLMLVLAEERGSISGSLEYSLDLYNRETVSGMVRHFERVIKEVVTDADQRIKEIELLSSIEREQMLVNWNETSVEYPRDRSIQELFEEHVEQRPESVAVVYQDDEITYRELNRRANQLAHYLRRLGVGPEVPVGICVERNLEMTVGLLGILKAGGAYLPLDPAYPADRLRYMLEDGEPQVLLTEERLSGHMPDFSGATLYLDRDWPLMAGESEENPPSRVRGDNLAYVIYTSGSTGQPKGVSVTQRNVVRLVKNNHYAALDHEQIFLQNAPLTFDAATFELWGALTNGGCLVVMARQGLDVWQLGEVITRRRVTTLWLTASLFNAVVDIKGGIERLRGVAQLLVGGEALSPTHIRLAAERLPGTELINGYGPTEGTTFSCCHRIGTMDLAEGTSIPIGRAIANTELYILDERQCPVPVGVWGELYIGGAGVTRGYLRRPELTAERFLPSPYSREGGERLYRTGDVVRYRLNGEVEFIGRTDDQVKLRGYRIELGEIEAALNDHRSVKQSAVVVYEDERGDKSLLGYAVGEEGVTAAELKRHVRERLPEYMVPEKIMLLKEMPLTVNGKIDRKRLPVLISAGRQAGQIYKGARTPVEEILAGIFEEVLKLDRVGVHDNFFETGGHSLLATQVISRVRESFGIEIGVRSIFEESTVEGLARRIEETIRAGAKGQAPPLVKVSREGKLPLSFAQQRLWFIDQLDPGNATYNIPCAVRLKGWLNLDALEKVINEIIRRHEALRTRIEVVENEPVQVIDEWEYRKFEMVDLKSLAQAEREEEVRRITKEDAELGFDLRRGPLVRAKALRLEDDEHIALFTMHHIVSDGWSIGVLVNEIGKLYQAYCAGDESPLDDLSIQYADFAVWQRQWLKAEVLEKLMRYWEKQLEHMPELELPAGNGLQKFGAAKSASHMHVFTGDVAKAVRNFREQKEATQFMALLTAFAIALHRFTGQRDLVIGTDIANRNRAEIEPLIGFFVNELLLRIKIEDDPTFGELLGQVREVALDAYLHQDIPFDKLVEMLNPERRNSQTPFIRAKLVVQNAPIKSFALPGLAFGGVSDIGDVNQGLKCDFLLTFVEQGQGLIAHVTYNEAIIQKSTAVALLQTVEKVLITAGDDPTLKLSELKTKLADAQSQQKRKIAGSLKIIETVK